MSQTLEWLWDCASAPVLNALGHRRRPESPGDWPRMWWVPGGALGLLPVHASGYHGDPADDPGRRTVMDRVISSYTPTTRALRHARARLRAKAGSTSPSTRSLIVAMPTTPGLPGEGRLHHVRSETAAVSRHLPKHVLLSTPDASDCDGSGPVPPPPAKETVLAHLRECPIAHFACHGVSDSGDPSKSALLLNDWAVSPMTVADLAALHLDTARMAYLSACRTAIAYSAGLSDEAIHLASAFQLAGFPSVVGTLWSIDDRTSVSVADAFYAHLRTDGGLHDTARAAYALHAAVKTVRDRLPRTPSVWAAYLHVGA
ncbi:CHAT domain-containing protein [Streptomyces sp. NPDC058737]|uniref:CHAT domain-containing protein n=1 Tax=Streptomyces sp. NPDC058737 TaxID=3346617 RepID=UPI00369CB26A